MRKMSIWNCFNLTYGLALFSLVVVKYLWTPEISLNKYPIITLLVHEHNAEMARPFSVLTAGCICGRDLIHPYYNYRN